MRLARLLLAAKTAIFRTVPLVRDARVPTSLKLIAAAIALLVISPIDVFRDIPVLGALDDAALLTRPARGSSVRRRSTWSRFRFAAVPVARSQRGNASYTRDLIVNVGSRADLRLGG